MRNRLTILLCGVGLFFSLTSESLFAQTWNVDANGNWTTNANWLPAANPNAIDAVATLGGIITANRIVTLTANRTVGTLTINDDNNYTLSGGSQLRMNVSAGSAAINVLNSGSPTISAPVRLADNMIITHTGTGLFTMSGVISQTGGARSITHTGTGTTLLSRNNTFSGGLTITSGTVRFGNNGANGTGTLTLNGGTIEASGGARTLNESVTVGGNFSVGGSNDLTLSGAMSLGAATRTITVNNTGATAFSGVVSGAGGLTKAGTGTLSLSGAVANTYTGTTTVNAGTLRLAKTAGVAAIAGSAITVNSGGTLLLGASNQINNTANLTLNGGTLSTGQTVGFSETLGTLTLSSSSSINLGTAAHMLNFADSSALSGAWSGTLTILGWTGVAGSSGTAGQIFFGSTSSGLTSTQLTMISFNGFGSGSILLSSGELVPVPVPEAEVILAAGLLALIVIYRERQRLVGLLPRLSLPFFA